MASLVPALDTSLNRQAMAYQADLLQNLGAQVRKDVTTVMTNRQMQGLAQGLQSVDTTSPQFGRQITGLLAQYPLAAQSPLGQAAINQLGAEFKLNQQLAAENRRFDNQLGLLAANDWVRNRAPYGRDVTVDDLRRVASSRGRLPIDNVGSRVNQPPVMGGQQNPLFDVNDVPMPQEAPAEIIPGIANPNASIVQPPAPAAGSEFVQKLDAFMNDQLSRGVPRKEADRRLRIYESQLKSEMAAQNRAPRIIQTDRGVAAVDPATMEASPLQWKSGGNVQARTTAQNPSRVLASEVRASEKLIKDYEEELKALKMGTGVERTPSGGYRAWRRTPNAPTTGEWVEVPAKEGERWLMVNDQLAKLREQVKQQRSKLAEMALSEVEEVAAEPNVTIPAAAATPTAPARPRIRYTNGQVIVQ